MRPTRCWRWCPRSAAARSIATRHKGSGNAVYHFDIRLQGDNETVFFEL